MNTANDSATARPWRAEGWEGIVVNAADGSTIVACPGGSYGASIEELRANARLIVRAVNAHEALCEALAALERAYMLTVHPDPSAMEIALLERARTALKLARGEG